MGYEGDVYGPKCFILGSKYSIATCPPVNYHELGENLTGYIAVGTFDTYYVIKIKDVKCIKDVSLLNTSIKWTDKLNEQLLTILKDGNVQYM